MSKKLLAHTKAVRIVLKTPESWTKNAFARNKLGKPVPFDAPDAVCHCLSGASLLVRQYFPPEESFNEAFTKTASSMGRTASKDSAWVPAFNDDPSTTHEDVIVILDEMIRRLSGERHE